MLRDLIEEASSSDQVFQKNNDLLNTAENTISYYTVEQTRNWDLSRAALKESVHFAMISMTVIMKLSMKYKYEVFKVDCETKFWLRALTHFDSCKNKKKNFK